MNVQNIQDVKNKNTSNSLDLFVEKMKFIALNEVSIPWDSDRWVIKNVAIKFTKISDNALHNEKMNSDSIKFSKAYIINETPCKTHRLQMIIPTLRCLEHVLIKNYSSGNICNVNYSILGEVIDLIKHKYSVSYICAISGELKKIVSFLNQNNFTYKYIGGWKSPIKDNRNYFKSNDEQSKKLPSEDVMYIFADIFRQDLTDVRDIFTTSIFALLMSAPSRISEVLSLSIDCMFTNKTRKGDQKWGLRFWAGKGFGGDIKWIPSTMVPVTQKAIYRIIEITKEARKFAKLMELDFKSFHKQSKFKEYAENKVLSAIQICEIMFNDTFSEKECKKSLKRLSLVFHDNFYSLKTLWQELQMRLPNGFPWFNKSKNIKYSDLLFLFFRDTFHTNKSNNIIEIYVPDRYLFQGNVLAHKRRDTIFQRHGYQNGRERTIYFHSHQLRHLLNTIAKRNGMTEYDLAKSSIKQNRVYNHVSDEEILENYEAIKLSAPNYSISNAITVRDPISKEILLSLNHSAVHKTEFGYCVHDYALSPCEKFRDCLNCSEQICVKGNFDNLERLKKRLVDTNELIDITIKNSDENDSQLDKDRWLTFHLKTQERLQELIGILENKEVPNGSFVRLANKSYSHLSRVINAKDLLEHRNGENNVKKIN
ncbi:hypothetical protein [Klebsiella sp. Kpp]|uniref:hypothetical protein n=1 Tax=Klebsiella sp. Kpp TaxID=2758578 RepID=UPI001643E748|nr:hypothetical protein [Klebsiella sp. Kpp]MBC3626285.1 hypothetical protein [Klebsiella sp. Kpp]